MGWESYKETQRRQAAQSMIKLLQYDYCRHKTLLSPCYELPSPPSLVGGWGRGCQWVGCQLRISDLTTLYKNDLQ